MTTTIDPQPTRLIFSAVTVVLGGYLLIQSLSNNLPHILSGLSSLPGEFTALLLLHLVIAVAALSLGWLVAPASIGRRLGAAGLGIGLAILHLVFATMRLTSEFGRAFGAAGLWLQQTLGNAHFMVALAVVLGWLIVSRTNGFAYLLLLPIVALAPVPFWMVLAGLSSGIIQITMLILWFVIVLGILGLSLLFVTRRVPAPAPVAAPVA